MKKISDKKLIIIALLIITPILAGMITRNLSLFYKIAGIEGILLGFIIKFFPSVLDYPSSKSNDYITPILIGIIALILSRI